jgi:hypothetical protein
MMKIEGSGSAFGSISQRHGSSDPDPHQNVMDPQHCKKLNIKCYQSINNLETMFPVCSSADESEDSEGEEEEDGQEEVKMVLVVRNDLKMGKGKVGR